MKSPVVTHRLLVTDPAIINETWVDTLGQYVGLNPVQSDPDVWDILIPEARQIPRTSCTLTLITDVADYIGWLNRRIAEGIWASPGIPGWSPDDYHLSFTHHYRTNELIGYGDYTEEIVGALKGVSDRFTFNIRGYHDIETDELHLIVHLYHDGRVGGLGWQYSAPV